MPNMTWEYLAGFFDGEGCITSMKVKKGYKMVGRIQISQSQDRGKILLDEIREFFAQHGITSSICSRAPYGNRVEGHFLYINSQESSMKFMRGVFPYLRIKKLEAQDTMRYLVMYPPPKAGRIVRDDTWSMVKDYEEGKSYRDIAHERGMNYQAVYMRIKSHLILMGRKFKINPKFAFMSR